MAEEVDIDSLLEAPLKKEEESKDKDKDKKRRRSSSRDRDRDRDRRRSSSRDRKRSTSRDRDKDRGRDRKRSTSRDRDRERRRSSSRERRRSSSRERRSSSRRSRSRSPYSSSSSRRSDRNERSRDEREKDREFDREKRMEREERDRKVRELSVRERNIFEEERNSRTVFVAGLPPHASQRQLFEFFEKSGRVIDVRLIAEHNSRKSKGLGLGYVEYAEQENVARALSMSGSVLLGHPVMIDLTQAERNKNHHPLGAGAPPIVSGPGRLHVGSLHTGLNENELRALFEPFGEIDYVNLIIDNATQTSRGFGFVQYKKVEDAKRALQEVNGIDIVGKKIVVTHVAADPLNKLSKEAAQIQSNPIAAAAAAAAQHQQQIATAVAAAAAAAAEFGGPNELDDDHDGGLALNAHSKLILMAKLQERAGVNPLAPLLSVPKPQLPTQPILPPSTCVLLKHMFDPSEAKGSSNFEMEIKDEVMSECSQLGNVIHIHVDTSSQEGCVYLKLAKIEEAKRIIGALNGRYFAKRSISAEYFPEVIYHKKFPASVY